MIVLLDDRWSYFGAVAQIAPDGPKCPMIGHPVFQCRFCRVLQKSVRIAVIEPAIQHISVFCVRNFIGGIDRIAPPVLRRSGQRKCTENVPLSIDALISAGGRYPRPESGRAPRRFPRPDRTEPGRRPLRRRSTAHPTGIPARAVWRLSHGRAGPCSRESGGRSSSWQALPSASPLTPVMHSGLEPLLRQKPSSWSNS